MVLGKPFGGSLPVHSLKNLYSKFHLLADGAIRMGQYKASWPLGSGNELSLNLFS